MSKKIFLSFCITFFLLSSCSPNNKNGWNAEFSGTENFLPYSLGYPAENEARTFYLKQENLVICNYKKGKLKDKDEIQLKPKPFLVLTNSPKGNYACLLYKTLDGGIGMGIYSVESKKVRMIDMPSWAYIIVNQRGGNGFTNQNSSPYNETMACLNDLGDCALSVSDSPNVPPTHLLVSYAGNSIASERKKNVWHREAGVVIIPMGISNDGKYVRCMFINPEETHNEMSFVLEYKNSMFDFVLKENQPVLAASNDFNDLIVLGSKKVFHLSDNGFQTLPYHDRPDLQYLMTTGLVNLPGGGFIVIIDGASNGFVYHQDWSHFKSINEIVYDIQEKELDGFIATNISVVGQNLNILFRLEKKQILVSIPVKSIINHKGQSS